MQMYLALRISQSSKTAIMSKLPATGNQLRNLRAIRAITIKAIGAIGETVETFSVIPRTVNTLPLRSFHCMPQPGVYDSRDPPIWVATCHWLPHIIAS